MKLNYQFVFQPVGQIYVATAVGEEARLFNGMIQLNATGYRIVQLIEEGLDRDQIVAKMLEEYDATETQMRNSVNNLIEHLKANNILTD